MNKKYQIIYADPPWKYNFSPSSKSSMEQYYPTIATNDICKLKVPSDDNSVLYLWATSPKLKDALKVMEAWGFEYKTHFIWDKDCVGMGYWFLGQHELLLVGTKGKFIPPKARFRVSSIYTEKKQGHSKKPKYIRNLIDRSFVGMSKLELFAREKVEGWDCWGNEVESDIEL
jgi:N6-adenosine-specific RNA methylase IME4